MFDLNHRIARLELRAEQFLLHLRSLDKRSAEAKLWRADLYALLQELARLKGKRQRLTADLRAVAPKEADHQDRISGLPSQGGNAQPVAAIH
jgi:predicted  nucleic acid-binding Zn-ribbon protein